MTSTFAKMIDPAHKSAARILGYALTLDSSPGWEDFALILRLRLSRRERVSLAYAAALALDPDDVRETAEAVLRSAGHPVPPLYHEADEAAFWADSASPDVLRAYALASFNRLSPRDQADFLAFVSRRTAA